LQKQLDDLKKSQAQDLENVLTDDQRAVLHKADPDKPTPSKDK
jgi:hypothetical protein